MHRTPISRRFAAGFLTLLATASLGIVGGLTAALVAAPMAANASSAVGGAITRAETLTRAQYWVDQGYVYSPNAPSSYTYSDDASGRSYRNDCSGLVSEAWHLSTSYTTADFAVDNSLWHTIAWDDMQPGDAYVRNDSSENHIELFYGWLNPSDHSAGILKYSFNSNGYTVENPYAKNNEGLPKTRAGLASYSQPGFHAIRYNNIYDGTGSGGVDDGDIRYFSSSSGSSLEQSYYNGSWNDQDLTVTFTGDPVAVHDGGTLRVFMRGYDLEQDYWNGSTWAWQDLGIPITGDPGVVNDGVLRVFARGSNGTLHQIRWTGTAWVDQDLGFPITGGVSALDNGWIRVFAREADGNLHQIYWNGSTWTDQSLGLAISGDPSAVDNGGWLRVFTRGSNGTLHQIYWSGSSWTSQDLGFPISSDPSALVDDRLRVFARNSTGGIDQLYYYNSTWTRQTIVA